MLADAGAERRADPVRETDGLWLAAERDRMVRQGGDAGVSDVGRSVCEVELERVRHEPIAHPHEGLPLPLEPGLGGGEIHHQRAHVIAGEVQHVPAPVERVAVDGRAAREAARLHLGFEDDGRSAEARGGDRGREAGHAAADDDDVRGL
jgi:hypothetical protein